MRPALLVFLACLAAALVWHSAGRRASNVDHGVASADASAPTDASTTDVELALGTQEGRAIARDVDGEPDGAARPVGPTLSITGVVLGAPAGASKAVARPVGGLTASARSKIDGQDHVDRQPSDADGRFTLRLPDPGQRPYSRSVDVYKDERYAGARVTVRFDEGSSRVDDVEVLVREHADLTGRVVDPRGRPVGGVEVRSFISGTEPLSARTDLDGRFTIARPVLAWHQRVLECQLVSDAWMSLDDPDTQREVDGRWTPVVLVASRRAILDVRVVDGSGDPVTGERLWAGYTWAGGIGRRPGAVETDVDGTARIEGLPADVQVHVGAMVRSCGYVVEEDGELVLVDPEADGARTLVLDPAAETRVLLRLGPRVTIRGRVLESDGSASPGAQVSLVVLDEKGLTCDAHGARTDERGNFESSFVLAEPAHRLVVAARSRVGEEPALSPFGGPKLPEVRQVDHQVYELPATASFETEVVLRLQPQPRIEGRVLGPEGEPLRGATVRIEGLDAAELALLRSASARSEVTSGNDGRFRFSAVPLGAHELVATAHELGATRVRGVAAGADDVELRFEEAEVAVVHVEVVSSEALKQVTLLRSMLRPRRPVDAPRLPANLELEEPTGWPAESVVGRMGTRTLDTEFGRTTFYGNRIEGTSDTLRLAPGLYWIGARGTFDGGGKSVAIGTGLVRVEAGEHRVRITLAPTGEIQVVLDESRFDEALFVQVTIPGGSALDLDLPQGGRARRVDGGLLTLPCRPLELQLGTPAELDAGRPRLRKIVTPVAGEVIDVQFSTRR